MIELNKRQQAGEQRVNPSLETSLEQLRQSDLQVAVQASLDLAKMGEAAVDALIGVVRDPEQRRSWWLAAQALGLIGDQRAVETLIEFLQNPLSFEAMLARKYTAYALSRLANPRAVDALIGMLHERMHEEEVEDDGSVTIYDDPEYETIEAAAGALAAIGEWRGIRR